MGSPYPDVADLVDGYGKLDPKVEFPPVLASNLLARLGAQVRLCAGRALWAAPSSSAW